VLGSHNRPFIPDGLGPCLGLRVIASARRVEALADLKALGMDTVLLDVTDTAAITAAKEQVHSLTDGKLDILVNNACVLSTILKQMAYR
jgi:NADP-dependent 3-hydroxy acid dehydrogenase YdfG